ncbi:MAG: VIT and VWA domain-containing protein [Methanoregula sp.]|jgi:Ca-activated chloride channel family protein|nr:VIT and VWA domain-containing protein [Methanoregula sp.]
MIFNPNWYENSRPDSVAVLEIIATGEHKPVFVPLTKTTLKGQVAGPLADFTLTHTFRYTKETNPHVIEALYRFPLPGDAAVTSVDVTFGEVTIHSILKARKEAETDYKNAKKENRAAALVTRESTDVFTLRIAGIAPDEDVIIKTRYVQIGQLQGTGFSFRIPLTTSPRYVRSDEQYSRHANGQPLAVLRDPGHRFSLSVTVGGSGTMKSPTHKITVTHDGTVTLDQGEVIPDRDCVLTWDPVPGDKTPACDVFSDGKDETHFLALVSPPRQPPVQYPRDVIILVDHSGSMEGPKWEAADWAVERFISGLTGKDTFNLCLFESRTYWLSEQPLVANEGNKTQAIQFLKDKRAGGTELGVALEQATSQQRRNGILSRNIIIITDAEVSDAARILRIVDKESQHKEARRFSILCIDASPNANLAQQLAERGGGIAKFLSSSPKEEDITSALDEILALWDAPVAVGLMLRVNRENLLVDKRKVKKSPDGMCHVDLGDLSSGKSTWVVVRAPQGNVPIRFELCGPEKWTLPVSVIPCPAVSVLFGARLVAELEYLMHAGYPEKELSRHLAGLGYDKESLKRRHPEKVYSENQMQDAMGLVRDIVVRESLKYQVISAETAFIAVRTEPGRTIEEQVIIPNALPFGWSESFVTSYTGMRKECVRRGSRPQPCGGGPIDWVGGGGGMDMIMQPDGTMKLDPRDSLSSTRKSSNVIVPKNVSPSSQSQAVPVNSETQIGYRLFEGIPVFIYGEAILFDSSRPEQANKVPKTVVLKKLECLIKDRIAQPDTRMYLLLYLDDTAVPRLKVLIKDLLQHSGSRPLNLQRTLGELLKIVLVDPDGEWAKQVPRLELVVR